MDRFFASSHHELGFEAQNASGNFYICQQRIEHRVQRLARDCCLEEGDVEKVVDAAVAIEREASAGDRVERACRGVFDRLPSQVAPLKSGSAHASVGIVQERAPLRHGQPFSAAVSQNHVEFELRRDRVVELAPGLNAVDAELGGEHFLLARHRVARLFTKAIQIIARAGERRQRREFDERRIGNVFERAQELDPNFGKLRANTRYLGLFTQVSFVTAVGRSETTHVGTEVRHEKQNPVASELSSLLRKFLYFCHRYLDIRSRSEPRKRLRCRAIPV